MRLPPIAASQGDPKGIGAEILLKAWAQRDQAGIASFFAIGDLGLFQKTAEILDLPSQAIFAVQSPLEVEDRFSRQFCVLSAGPQLGPDPKTWDEGACSQSARAAIEIGARLTRDGTAAALVTAPIAKRQLSSGYGPTVGHTEFLAQMLADASVLGRRGPVMLLQAGDLRVALATIHVALKDAPGRLSIEGLVRLGKILDHGLRLDFGVPRPRIALAALNPHAGEDGAYGREEIDILNPAAAILRAQGLDISDARPADSLFHDEARKTYDCVLAMTHDQGLIPIKTIDFWGGVNITLGLPIVRTSPDHGTARDIAGKGLARPESVIAALRLAEQIARRRRGLV